MVCCQYAFIQNVLEIRLLTQTDTFILLATGDMGFYKKMLCILKALTAFAKMCIMQQTIVKRIRPAQFEEKITNINKDS